MQAVVCREGKAELDWVPIPELRQGECMIRILRAGICKTDLEMILGYKDGFEGILGHEFVGIVERAEENEQLVGQRVVGEINLPCQSSTCGACIEGRDRKRNHCPNRKCLGIVGLDGSFAEFIVLPEENLFILPESISDSQAVFVEPLAAACRIKEQGVFQEGKSVCIVGDGKLGLLIAQVASHFCIKENVTLIGRHPEKMSKIANKIGQCLCLENIPEAMQDEFDVVVDATGSVAGLQLACELVRPLGTVVLKTTCSGANHGTKLPTNLVVVKEIKIVGSRCGPFQTAIELLSLNIIDVECLLEQIYPLEEAITAIDHAAQKGSLKIQIVMNSG